MGTLTQLCSSHPITAETKSAFLWTTTCSTPGGGVGGGGSHRQMYEDRRGILSSHILEEKINIYFF